jgi:hypothetical protein
MQGSLYKICWKATFKRILYDLPIAPHCQAHLRKQLHYVTLRSTKPHNDKPKPKPGRTHGAVLKFKNEDIRDDRIMLLVKVYIFVNIFIFLHYFKNNLFFHQKYVIF